MTSVDSFLFFTALNDISNEFPRVLCAIYTVMIILFTDPAVKNQQLFFIIGRRFRDLTAKHVAIIYDAFVRPHIIVQFNQDENTEANVQIGSWVKKSAL